MKRLRNKSRKSTEKPAPPAIPLARPEDDALCVLLLSICYGGYFLLLTWAMYLPGELTERKEFLRFVQTWLTAPALAILFALLVDYVRRKWVEGRGNFYPVLLLANGVFLFLMISAVHWAWKARALRPFFNLLWATAILFPLLTVGIIGTFKSWPQPPARQSNMFAHVAYVLFPLVVALALLNFSGFIPYYFAQYSVPLRRVLEAAVVAPVLLVAHRGLAIRTGTKTAFSIDAIAVLLIVGACFDPRWTAIEGSSNFHLGPVNSLLRGRSMLVDVYSQYGVLVMYFLAFLFWIGLFPLSYQGFALVLAVCYVIQYLLIYLLLRVLLRSPIQAILLLGLIVLASLFATMGIAQCYPSIGPLRFGPGYVVAALILVRHRFPRMACWGLWMEYAFVGLTSLWSFETFFYVVSMYLAISFYESLATGKSSRQFIRHFGYRLLGMGVALAASHLVFVLATYLRSGAWPSWGPYLDYTFLYSMGGYGTLPMDNWGLGTVLTAIYLASLLAFASQIFFLRRMDPSVEAKIVFGLTIFGIAQFTYYVARSHPNNLYHISIPAVIVAAYWTMRLARQSPLIPRSFQDSALCVFYSMAVLLAIVTFPHLKAKYSCTGYSLVQGAVSDVVRAHKSPADRFAQMWSLLWGRSPTSAECAEAISLMRKYAPDQKRVVLFIRPDETTQALLLSGKAQLYPINHPIQDGLSPRITMQILSFKPPLHEGDIIFLATEPRELIIGATGEVKVLDIQRLAVLDLCKQFDLEEIERTPHGVSAMRLRPLRGAPPEYCAKLRALSDAP